MTFFTGNQIRYSDWRRSLLSVVLIAWLTTALQPCLMAMEMSQEPMAGAAMSMVGHSDRASQGESSATEKCTHCPTVGTRSEGPCESALQSDCNQSPSYHDARTTSVKAKDAPCDVPVGVAPCIAVISIESGSFALPSCGDRSFVPGDPPSLHVLYGVYLI